jgi:hypothetical protein
MRTKKDTIVDPSTHLVGLAMLVQINGRFAMIGCGVTLALEISLVSWGCGR